MTLDDCFTVQRVGRRSARSQPLESNSVPVKGVDHPPIVDYSELFLVQNLLGFQGKRSLTSNLSAMQITTQNNLNQKY